MSEKQSGFAILLTQRAIRDLHDIERFSHEQWGASTAARYIGSIEQALNRLREQPELLRPEGDHHPYLLFYRVNKHLLVCDRQPSAVLVLTIIHASRDIPSRLAELAPTLSVEAELLHKQLHQPKRRRG